jgi:CHAT domain-containing protein/tetratricopeptide (TPR) repeat protein
MWFLLLWATAGHAAPSASIEKQLRECERLCTAKRWASTDSLALATVARIEAEAPQDTLARAAALYHVAFARLAMERYPDSLAIAYAEECVRLRQRALPSDDLDLASAHFVLARFLVENRRGDRGLANIETSLSIRQARVAPGDSLLGITWFELGRVHYRREDFRSAIEPLERSRQIFVALHGPSHPQVALVLNWIGETHRRLQDFDRARTEIEESIRMYEVTLGAGCREAMTPLGNLARLESDIGNHARSVDLFHSLVDLAVLQYGPNDRKTANQRDDLGDRLLRLADAEGAREQFELALPIFSTSYGPTHTRTLGLRTKIGLACLESGDSAQAYARLSEIRPLLENASGGPEPMLAYCLEDLAIVLLSRGDAQGALELVGHGLQVERAKSRPDGSYLTILLRQKATIALFMNDRNLLEECHRELSARLDGMIMSPAERGEVLVHRARVRERLGLHAQACEDARLAERLSREAALANVYALSNRQALIFAQYLSNPLDEVVELAIDGDSAVRDALERIVQWHGMVRAALAARRPPATALTDTALAGAHARWLEAQARLARGVVQDNRQPGASSENLRVLRTAADEAERVYTLAAGGHIPAPIASAALLDSIQARLERGKALVSIVEVHPGTASARVFVFVARGREVPIRRLDLGSSHELTSAVAAWLQRIGHAPRTSRAGRASDEIQCRQLGAAVRALVWDPIADRLRDVADLYLVAAGPVMGLPWQALPAKPNGYLVERGPRIHVLNAERELLEEPVRGASNSLLAVGGVDFDRPSSHGYEGAKQSLVTAGLRSAVDDCDASRPLSFAPLPGSRLEAEAIAGMWNADHRSRVSLLTEADATEAAFKRAAPGRGVIHLATHGVVWSKGCAMATDEGRGVGGVDPLLAGKSTPPKVGNAANAASLDSDSRGGRRVWLALAGANHAREHHADENEGLLTADEVLTIDLEGTDWVVLSACHSGLAEAWSRQGTLGMRRAFDLAGARSVIASQWAVDDDDTREWMHALYRARAEGATSAAAAVESASRTILAERRRAGRSTHPFHWAAFSASGE